MPDAIWNDGAFLMRYWSKVDQRGIDECWPWTSAVVGRRGRIWLNGHNEVAPRIAKVLSDRKWPDAGMCACHSCDNPNCCNPSHIWWGSSAENTRDASAKGLLRGPEPHTHCKKGHELTPENRIAGVSRGCRICRRERFTAWQRKKRASQSGGATSAVTPNPSHPPSHKGEEHE